MRVKCLAQEHNAVPWPGLEIGPLDPESNALTINPPRLMFLSQRTLHNDPGQRTSYVKVKSVYEPRGPSGRSLSRFP